VPFYMELFFTIHLTPAGSLLLSRLFFICNNTIGVVNNDELGARTISPFFIRRSQFSNPMS
jgi:hypothetical protein